MKPTIKPINTSFRSFKKQHIDNVLLIERLAYSTPWSKKKFTSSLDNNQTLATLICINDKIIGYAVVLCLVDSADLLNLCIHPKYQHQGFGLELFSYLVKQLEESNIYSIILEVRRSNKVARSFYQKIGFELIDTRKKYYTDGEDAKILRLKIK